MSLVALSLAALEAPPGVVAIPAPRGAGGIGFTCGGAAVVIAPGLAITLREALPDDRATLAIEVAGRRQTAHIEREGTTTTAVLLSFTEPGPAAVPLADSRQVRLGDAVWTVGNSYGILEQDGVAALSRGIVSGLYTLPADAPPVRGRGGRVLSEYRGAIIETDAAVNDGNHGGALLDAAGCLVGLVSLGQARERRLGTVVPIHLICADLGLELALAAPAGAGDATAEALARAAGEAAASVALVYFERPSGLGNPEGMPRPQPLTDDLPPYQRQRIERDWDHYWHQQQIFFTDQPVPALYLGEGLLLTAASNLHGDAKRGRVLLEGGAVDCTVVSVHRPLDLALLRAEHALPLPAAVLGAELSAACGDAVAVVGRHRPGAGYTLTTGVVSATDRRCSQSEYAYHQTDAMANYGNLGGPVVRADGLIIGLIAMIGPYPNRPWFINSGVALFVDAATVRAVLPGLRNGVTVEQERTVGLGIQVAGNGTGPLRIGKVFPGTGAAAAGVLPGDLLLKIDAVTVLSTHDVSRVLMRRRVGDVVVLIVRRDAEEMKIEVELKPFQGEE